MGQRDDEELSRRDLSALLGALGGVVGLAALSGCKHEPAAGRANAQAAAALSGGAIASVPTILGAPPSQPRTGDLALGSPYQIGASVVVAEGCVTAGDGGGGIFVWSSTSTADDGGTVIVPKGADMPAGGWKRISGEALNVRWFGAQGAGTDDTLAFQNAFAAKERLGGGSIYIPSGRYGISRSIDVGDAPCVVFGDGLHCSMSNPFGKGPGQGNYPKPGVAPGSTLVFTATSGSALVFGAANPDVDVISGLEVRDIAIVGASEPNTIAIDLTKHTAGVNFVKISHVFIGGFDTGLMAGGVLDSAFRDLHIRGCNVGIDLGQAGNCQWFSTNVEACGVAILSTGGSNNSFYGGLVQSNSQGGVLVRGGELLTLDGFWFEANPYSIQFDSSNVPILACGVRNSRMSGHDGKQIISFAGTGAKNCTIFLEQVYAAGALVTVPSWVRHSLIDSCRFDLITNLGASVTIINPVCSTSVGDFGLESASVASQGALALLQPIPAPHAPASGFVLYVDQADGRLKAIGPKGTVTVLASP